MIKYSEYKESISEDLAACLERMSCQPILFFGSGMSRRYFNAPSWSALLKKLSEDNPRAKEYAYYKQKYGDDYPKIGTQLTDDYREWAWEEAKDSFPEDLYSENFSSDIFLKTKVSNILNSLLAETLRNKIEYKDEIESLKELRPHAVITTNYDEFLESIYPEYKRIIGEELLHNQYSSIGEIYKIHGCITNPSSIVINEKDYQVFRTKKKYLTAKLLTYFLEHPLIIMGYSASDSNIQEILSDIDEILASQNKLVENIYFVSFENDIDENETYPKEKIIRLNYGKSIRVKNIVTNEYSWIYNSLKIENALENVNPKLLRALLARTYELVRKDIPTRKVDIDYDTLEHALNSEGDLKSIFGITSVTDSKAVNIEYPYSLTGVAKKLGYNSWHYANNLIDRIRKNKEIDIKGSDNKYHIKIPTGKTSFSRRYSVALVDLLKKVKKGDDYNVDL